MIKMQITLTQGQFAIIDASDYELVRQYKWCAAKRAGKFYVETRRDKLIKSLHRLIMNAPKDKVVDHIDGNPLNNCRSNLRICSILENNRNRKLYKTNIIGLKGVTKLKSCNRWRARIRVNGKLICLGLYKTPEQAHSAYCDAASIYFKEFANKG